MDATSTVRGIEHVGITVPDIEEASAFLVSAFGAEVIYDLEPTGSRDLSEQDPDADDSDQATLGVRPGTRWIKSRVLRLGEGPSIELFEYADDEARPPATPGDLGIQHFGLYVDDIDVSRQKVIDAGGQPLAGPWLLPGPESGDGNKWIYTLSPWGSIIELTTMPSPMQYEEETPLRRWRPRKR
jgi:catechol 2,3-dioxygenase-like lactoylglutathione lyase family enzyme